jgi:hypothetical protein
VKKILGIEDFGGTNNNINKSFVHHFDLVESEGFKQIDKEIKQGDFELPKSHRPFIKVNKNGSSCATCIFLSPDKKNCTNEYFIKWNGDSRLPQPVSEYCSDWYQPVK